MKGELERRLYYRDCGGSWRHEPRTERMAFPHALVPSLRDGLLGLRLARRRT